MDKKSIIFNCEKTRLNVHHCNYCKFKTNVKVFLHCHIYNIHTKKGKNPLKIFPTQCYTCQNSGISTFSLLFWFKHNLTCLICQQKIKKQKQLPKSVNKKYQRSGQRKMKKKKQTIEKQCSSQKIDMQKQLMHPIEEYHCPDCLFKTTCSRAFKEHVMSFR